MNNKTILVTGGAGFIGSNFIHYMFKKYPDVKIINLDLLTYAGNLENLKDIAEKPNYTFVKGDIADIKVVNEVIPGADYIVNFAAESHVDRSIEDPSVFVRTNVIGTQVLLDAAKRHGVERFLQISTDEVYGSLAQPGILQRKLLWPPTAHIRPVKPARTCWSGPITRPTACRY